ncbi:hypothetical protein GQ457_07G027610 [Hibiscus cannabinus]
METQKKITEEESLLKGTNFGSLDYRPGSPDVHLVETLKSGTEGYNADVTVVTYGQSGKQSDDRSKIRILIGFGQHSRELITSELALQIVLILSEEQFLPGIDQGSLNGTLENLVIKVVPLENLNGRKLVEAGELCERRNGRRVDLNRNWGIVGEGRRRFIMP